MENNSYIALHLQDPTDQFILHLGKTHVLPVITLRFIGIRKSRKDDNLIRFLRRFHCTLQFLLIEFVGIR